MRNSPDTESAARAGLETAAAQAGWGAADRLRATSVEQAYLRSAIVAETSRLSNELGEKFEDMGCHNRLGVALEPASRQNGTH